MKRGTIDHPKTKLLAQILGIELWGAVGVLESFWHYTARYAPQGDIGKWSNDLIASGIGWTGESSDLIDALVNSRWVDTSDTYRLLVHDWKDHADGTVKKYLKQNGLDFLVGKVATSSNLSELVATSSNLSGKVATSSNLLSTKCGGGGNTEPEPEPEPEPSLCPSPASPKPGRVYQFKPEDMSLASEMKQAIASLNIGAKLPDDLSKWANTIRLIREQDRHGIDEIRRVFRWANADSWWCGHILSPNALRGETWPKLVSKMKMRDGPQPTTADRRDAERHAKLLAEQRKRDIEDAERAKLIAAERAAERNDTARAAPAGKP